MTAAMAERAAPPDPARLAAELTRAQRERLYADRGLVLVGHLALIAILAFLVWTPSLGPRLLWWTAAVTATTLARAAWQRRAGDPRLPDATILTGTRALTALQGLAWGIGLALLVGTLPEEQLAIALIGFAGLMASAANTLVADRHSLLHLLGATYVPVIAALLAHATGRDDVITAVLIVLFIAVVLSLQQRGRKALVALLRTTLALQASEAQFRRLADSNIIGIAFWDASGAITAANDEYLRTIGYPREDLSAGVVNFRTLTPPEYAATDTRVLERLAAGEQVPPWEKELIRKDGERVAVLIGVAPFKDRTDRGVVFTLDITERKVAEEHQRTLLRELQTALVEVKTLRGLIRICANCRRVLTDRGTWEQFEAYVRTKSDVEFSHGICPDCAAKWSIG